MTLAYFWFFVGKLRLVSANCHICLMHGDLCSHAFELENEEFRGLNILLNEKNKKKARQKKIE
jgi:hypothetical protein